MNHRRLCYEEDCEKYHLLLIIEEMCVATFYLNFFEIERKLRDFTDIIFINFLPQKIIK